VNSFVISSLLPVVLLIAAGYLAGQAPLDRRQRGQGPVEPHLPAAGTGAPVSCHEHRARRAAQPQAGCGVLHRLGVLFAGTLALRGFNRSAAVIALANTYSNTVIIGIALIGLAYGAEGMVVLLTLISLHSLVLMTSATLVLELASWHASMQWSAARKPLDGAHRAACLAQFAIIHPVPLPIMAGLLFAQTGLTMPEVIDKPIHAARPGLRAGGAGDGRHHARADAHRHGTGAARWSRRWSRTCCIRCWWPASAGCSACAAFRSP
jgi:malonate transporter